MKLLEENSSSKDDPECRKCCICHQQFGCIEDDPNIVFINECTRCTEDWTICAPCHASLITGKCPICRGDYSPLILREVPGPSLHDLGTAISDEWKAMLIYKHLILRRVLHTSNVAVLDTAQNKMNFSIPKFFEESGHEYSCLTVSVPVEAVQSNFRQDGKFVFNADVWDVIEELLQSNDEDNMDNEFTKPARLAAEWLLQLTGNPANRVFTMLDEEQWADKLDPLKCADAICSIQENVVHNTSPTPQISSDRTYNFLIHSA